MSERLIADSEERRINATDWQPLPGMVKVWCTGCFYWFAASDPAADICPDCVLLRRRRESKEREGLP